MPTTSRKRVYLEGSSGLGSPYDPSTPWYLCNPDPENPPSSTLSNHRPCTPVHFGQRFGPHGVRRQRTEGSLGGYPQSVWVPPQTTTQDLGRDGREMEPRCPVVSVLLEGREITTTNPFNRGEGPE